MWNVKRNKNKIKRTHLDRDRGLSFSAGKYALSQINPLTRYPFIIFVRRGLYQVHYTRLEFMVWKCYQSMSHHPTMGVPRLAGTPILVNLKQLWDHKQEEELAIINSHRASQLAARGLVSSSRHPFRGVPDRCQLLVRGSFCWELWSTPPAWLRKNFGVKNAKIQCFLNLGEDWRKMTQELKYASWWVLSIAITSWSWALVDAELHWLECHFYALPGLSQNSNQKIRPNFGSKIDKK